MSKLDELIEELCPDGVEYKRLDDIVVLTAGERIIKSMMHNDAKYYVYGGGAKPTGKYSKYNFRNLLASNPRFIMCRDTDAFLIKELTNQAVYVILYV